jgi:pimeloyl-ACP methyl ester carboxylesterase
MEYKLKSHQVQTEDGYILTVQRVHERAEDVGWPYGPDLLPPIKEEVNEASPKPVVLIVHGFQCSSSDWFQQNGEEKTLRECN